MFKCANCGGDIRLVEERCWIIAGDVEDPHKDKGLDSEEYFRCNDCGEQSDRLEDLVEEE